MNDKLVNLVPRRVSTERTIQDLKAEIARLNTELANLRAQIEAEQRTKELGYGIGLAVVCFVTGFLMGTVWVSL